MTLHLQTDGAIAHLVIDRAARRNAFTLDMWEALPVLVDRAMADDAVRVLVVRAAQSGVFCAGADIAELEAGARDALWLARNHAAIETAQITLARSPKPTIAAIDGDCVGGGCGLAMACDLRVASAAARLGVTPAKLGLVYSLHDTKLLVDLVGPSQAKRILFTAALIDATEAHRIGLVDLLDQDWRAVAQSVADVSPHSTRQSKAMIRRILNGQSDDDAETRSLFGDAFRLPDFAEGVAAFLGKRKARF